MKQISRTVAATGALALALFTGLLGTLLAMCINDYRAGAAAGLRGRDAARGLA